MSSFLSSFPKLWRMALTSVGLLIAFGVIVAGCGQRRAPLPGTALLLEAPTELRGARLLFQRPDGVWFLELGKPAAERVAEGGRWPRWSPDGRAFAFVRGNSIFLRDAATGAERELAAARKPRAVAFHPQGNEVWYTDGARVMAVSVNGGAPREALTGAEFMELALSPDGRFAVATVRALGGYRVARFDLPAGERRDIARGCSAGVSADGRLITVNRGGHDRLDLFDAESGAFSRELLAPPDVRLDNQQWSNHPDWMAAVIEGERQDIVIQRVSDGRVWRVTDVGDADRPDLWVEKPSVSVNSEADAAAELEVGASE